MKVRSKEFPNEAIAAAEVRRRSGEFDAQYLRSSMRNIVVASGIYRSNSEAYDAADAAATRLISKWAKEGKIKKVPGTRRWVAA